MKVKEAKLVLGDGTVFEGEAIGAEAHNGVQVGEVVFNTAMLGYQEIITDPTYASKLVAFTYTHVGNVGTTPLDDESARPTCGGIVIGEMSRRRSSWRSTEDLGQFLVRHGIAGIAGVDTRRVALHIRRNGTMTGAFGTADEEVLRTAAKESPSSDGTDLVTSVTCSEPYSADYTGAGKAPLSVVVYDLGLKRSLLSRITRFARVDVVPASTPASEVLAREPDGVVMSNGPGDPMAIPWAVDNIRGLLGTVPVLGVGLGHQLVGLALGAKTIKLPFGHHGGNHPVRVADTGGVEITAHHHSHALDSESLAGIAEVTHVDLNDGVVEGIRNSGEMAFGLQYHPEAGPSLRDGENFISQFVEAMSKNAKKVS